MRLLLPTLGTARAKDILQNREYLPIQSKGKSPKKYHSSLTTSKQKCAY